jgi:NADH:ubiquinone oxidoreductase subunit F (NADH-binding)
MTGSLLDLLEDAGLTGRGGAGFSTAVKVRATVSGGATLIVNACDGEYGAIKDRFVITHHHDELAYGANLLGRNGVRYAAGRGSRSETLLRTAGLDVLSVPHRYVASEELARVAGERRFGPADHQAGPCRVRVDAALGRGPPADRRPQRRDGLANRSDREHGAAWFRSFGTPDEPGPRLVSVSGAVGQPSVVEAAAGARVADLLDAAGGAERAVAGVGIGSLSGGWLTGTEADRAVWSRAGLHAYGFTPGPGTVHVLGADECPITHVAAVLDHAAGESTGQCGPCLFGVPAVAEDFRLLADRRIDHAGVRRL